MSGTKDRPEQEARAPLFEQLVRHARNRAASYHVPGHKNGQGYAGTEAGVWFEPLLRLDVTEIEGMDDLHQPDGVIAEAQRLAADCFGAEETAFLVGGSTVGNLAMVMGVCGPGDLLIVQRNVHKSVLHALQLAGAHAVFVEPRLCGQSGLAGGVDRADLQQALQRYPEVRGVLLTNPNYYGMGVDLAELAELVHDCGKPLLVDEAHGAHYGLHAAFPKSAMQAGADAAVQSAHKMLPAMTMGAYLHMKGDRVPRQAIRQLLRMLQSSSPSYPIMASLDWCRYDVAIRGEAAFAAGLAAAAVVRERLGRADSRFREAVARQADGARGTQAYSTLDPFKLTIYDSYGELGGFELQRRLGERGCYAEMADVRHVLLAFSGASTAADAERLLQALAELGGRQEGAAAGARGGVNAAVAGGFERKDRVSSPVRLLPWREAARTDGSEQVAIGEAEGRIAAEAIIPYPPGIPLVLPGERLEAASLEELYRLWRSGCRFQGGFDSTAGLVRVIER